ncbi:hypothetical protein WN943_029784 [Citrus x changshan-huyou]
MVFTQTDRTVTTMNAQVCRSTVSRCNLVPTARRRHCNLVAATARQSSPLLVLHESDLPLLLVAESPPPLPPAATAVICCCCLLPLSPVV